jgi:hypothetical protein
MWWRTIALLTLVVTSCRETYVAPPPRELPPVGPTRRGTTDPGDAPTIRVAEQRCLSGLSPRAVASAFRAVDEVADALLDLCSIGIVDDDPLVWHVWCGSDALFRSGHYLPAEARSVPCGGESASSAFECIGRIMGRHLLSAEMSEHVEAVEIVTVGSVDREPLAPSAAFLMENPCSDLQAELGLSGELRWTTPEGRPGHEERAGLWNQRLSWCRAASSALQLRRGMSGAARGRLDLSAIGAGMDWLDDWRATHADQRCPTPPEVSGESRPTQCRDARRVDLFVRVRAREGTAGAGECSPPRSLPGGASGQALYCYSECRARAAVGRNPHGYRVPESPADLLFTRPPVLEAPRDWIVQSTAPRIANTPSVRRLLLRRR